MFSMFNNCFNLINLDISNFNTKNVNNMSLMFSNCYNLINLDINNFNTENVKDMSYMFNNCSNLIIFNFKTQLLIDISELFSDF